jgi:formamidopyrimidine-DNA glycosylase
MAEVPEVETIVRDLREAVVGRTVRAVEVLRPETVRLQGRTVAGAERRAKHILLPLGGDQLLEMHFMLWGTLLLHGAGAPRAPETLIVYQFEDGDELHFLDTLGYARAALGTTTEVSARLKLHELGPEALSPSFDVGVLGRQLAKRRGALKSVLLNQKVLAGLGNRDADESMWLARIDPRRAPTSLTTDELARLHDGICQILDEGLALRGTQADLWGKQGQAKHRRYVFERTGRPCPRCGTPIAHLRIGGRNTHYCPHCQH